MKFFRVIIIIGVLIVIQRSHASNHNLTSQAFGSFIGLFNLEYSYRFSDHCTLGFMGSKGKGKLDLLEISGSSYGLIFRSYLEPAFESNSWYFVLSSEKRDFLFTVRNDQKDYFAESRGWVASGGGGYHWFWKSFNISFGLLVTNQQQLELKTSSGEVYQNKLNPGLGLDFTIGGKF